MIQSDPLASSCTVAELGWGDQKHKLSLKEQKSHEVDLRL